MAIKGSGPLRLKTHIGAEVGVSSAVKINKSGAVRALIGKAAGETTRMSEYYGASNAPELVGTLTREEVSLAQFESQTGSLKITSLPIQPGDFVVIAWTSDNTTNIYNRWSGMAGLKRLDGSDATVNPSSNEAQASPGNEVVCGVWAAGDTDITVKGLTYTGAPIAMCLAVWRNVNGRLSHKFARNTANGTPKPPESPAVSSGTSIIIATGHLDDQNEDMGAPSGYQMACRKGATNFINPGNKSSTAIAYKLTTSNGAETPSNFTVSREDSWAGHTIRA